MNRAIPFVLALCCLMPCFSLDVQRDIVLRSQRYVGSSYVTGGTQPPQFDCSGFVGYIVRPFVPSLPRLSKDMAAFGTPVPRDSLIPGDLVFFATTAVPGAISHVALYIGQGSIIHAISDGPDRGVNITSLDSRYWKDHYHSAARVLAPASGTQDATADAPIRYAKGVYTGSLRNGEPDGQGTLELSNGDRYVGAFSRGRFSGSGTYTWRDGSRYEGQFKDGSFAGGGFLTGADGKRAAVTYRDGAFVPVADRASGKRDDKPVARESYLRTENSPWETWNGYVSGDYDQWKAAQDAAFEAHKNRYSAGQEQRAYEEWKKTQGL